MCKINASDKIMIENQKKRKNMELKKFLHKSPSKISFRHKTHSLQRRADARGSADIIYHILRISLYLRGRHRYLGQKVGHT